MSAMNNGQAAISLRLGSPGYAVVLFPTISSIKAQAFTVLYMPALARERQPGKDHLRLLCNHVNVCDSNVMCAYWSEVVCVSVFQRGTHTHTQLVHLHKHEGRSRKWCV